MRRERRTKERKGEDKDIIMKPRREEGMEEEKIEGKRREIEERKEG